MSYGSYRFYKAIAQANLKASAKHLLNALVRFADFQTGGNICAAVGTLASECGRSDRWAGEQLKILETLGLVEFVCRSRGGRGANGYGRTHELRLRLEAIQALAAPPERRRESLGRSNRGAWPAGPGVPNLRLAGSAEPVRSHHSNLTVATPNSESINPELPHHQPRTLSAATPNSSTINPEPRSDNHSELPRQNNHHHQADARVAEKGSIEGLRRGETPTELDSETAREHQHIQARLMAYGVPVPLAVELTANCPSLEVLDSLIYEVEHMRGVKQGQAVLVYRLRGNDAIHRAPQLEAAGRARRERQRVKRRVVWCNNMHQAFTGPGTAEERATAGSLLGALACHWPTIPILAAAEDVTDEQLQAVSKGDIQALRALAAQAGAALGAAEDEHEPRKVIGGGYGA